MPRKSAPAQQQSKTTPFDRLRSRFQAHVASPISQHNQCCRVDRLDSDNDDDWDRMLDDLRETEGVTVQADPAGVDITWRKAPDDE